MLFSHSPSPQGLARRQLGQPRPDDLASALWIDLYRPQQAQIAAVEGLGVSVPSLADMEEIEISARLYREAGADVMTVVLPGLSEDKAQVSGPVTFILSPERLVTVRHHAPRPFETYPERAGRVGMGCSAPERVFLGLIEEITGRFADLLEGVGKGLDAVGQAVYTPNPRPELLHHALANAGREGDILGRVRLAMLTVERALSFFGQTLNERAEGEALRPVVKGLMRDIQSLEVHADFLSARAAQVSDATLGMISLSQNDTVRIVSVVTALFLPPTLIASIYGMNFAHMPELALGYGYPLAIALMLGSGFGTYVFFKRKGWL